MILGREPDNVTWWELEQLAHITGWPLVGIGELAARDGRVVLGEDGSPVDVVAAHERGAAARRRRAAHRARLAADRAAAPRHRAGGQRLRDRRGRRQAHVRLLDRLVRFYCGAEPLLRSVPAWDLADDEQRAEALARLEELVFKPRDGAGGEGIVLGPRASAEKLSKLRAEIDADPSRWIAQEPVALSTHPTVTDGRLEPRHVDLRPFVIGGRVLPGGLSRFALGAGELVANCAQGGGGKDVWVLD